MEINSASARSCTHRSSDSRGRIDAFVSKNVPFHPNPNSFGRSRYPNLRRSRRIRSPHSLTRAFLLFVSFSYSVLSLFFLIVALFLRFVNLNTKNMQKSIDIYAKEWYTECINKSIFYVMIKG
jgi:hypothetical protein